MAFCNVAEKLIESIAKILLQVNIVLGESGSRDQVLSSRDCLNAQYCIASVL
jgi:hypothetical protein